MRSRQHRATEIRGGWAAHGPGNGQDAAHGLLGPGSEEPGGERTGVQDRGGRGRSTPRDSGHQQCELLYGFRGITSILPLAPSLPDPSLSPPPSPGILSLPPTPLASHPLSDSLVTSISPTDSLCYSPWDIIPCSLFVNLSLYQQKPPLAIPHPTQNPRSVPGHLFQAACQRSSPSLSFPGLPLGQLTYSLCSCSAFPRLLVL